MVEAAEDRRGAYRPRAIPPLRTSRHWHCLAEALVRPVPVEVGDILPEHAAKVALAEDEQVVDALAAHAPQ